MDGFDWSGAILREKRRECIPSRLKVWRVLWIDYLVLVIYLIFISSSSEWGKLGGELQMGGSLGNEINGSLGDGVLNIV